MICWEGPPLKREEINCIFSPKKTAKSYKVIAAKMTNISLKQNWDPGSEILFPKADKAAKRKTLL